MEVTPELLKKYAEGACNEQETELVEIWLSDSREEYHVLSEAEIKKSTKKMWNEIQTFQNRSDINIIKSLPHYAVAACLFIGLMIGSIYIIDNNFEKTNILISNVETGYLYISSRNANDIKIESKSCKINFTGVIMIANTSKYSKSIICENESSVKFQLLPGEIYYLSEENGIPVLFREKDATQTVITTRQMTGQFEVEHTLI
ncbi:hypothetical protein [Chondrinema litorale]|uniref:hypothetical protein n=1 Tax=Chondrinema litorale TaxID=2994555 RepID=UPI0025429F50|nr:hypothetical protein [Chondrinema litorale]UZR98508.1 hypothetical protein OQ292_31370 [Chondrinema litorale]